MVGRGTAQRPLHCALPVLGWEGRRAGGSLLQRHIVLLSLHCGCDYTFLCTMERQINSHSAACRSEGGTKTPNAPTQARLGHGSWSRCAV